MSEGDHIVVLSFCGLQVVAQFVRQCDPEVVWIVRATYVRKIDKNLLSTFEIDPATVSIPQREKRELVHPIGLLLQD
jgi:hypothetical protein